ncbi:MAG: type II secretion system GspH family protein [Aliidiomarina sp.]|uniref:pilus assembly FimT family protein n=1 Tax=Aliidiomarina sp. TaxID=1872439 RepID=UPI0025BDACA4|nr:type II secretion system protein [Aliidiomarina sp.]MCH8502470.1 type II secretion system GspH family protein [Aliidiomarina sp.]
MTGGRGFTLIELLVVLAIVGLLASLVGPVGFQQYERVRAIEEREQLYRLLEAARFDAFNKKQPLTFALRDREIVIWRGQRQTPERTIEFERLSFPEQQITVNVHGYWSHETVLWQEANQERSQRLRSVAADAELESSSANRREVGG